MNDKLLKTLLVAAMAGIMVAGCDVYVRPPVATAEVEVSAPPPVAEVDVRGVSPGPDFVWVGGNWVWGPSHRWEWERGRWDRPPHRGAVWVPHRYVERGGRHVFVRGGWR